MSRLDDALGLVNAGVQRAHRVAADQAERLKNALAAIGNDASVKAQTTYQAVRAGAAALQGRMPQVQLPNVKSFLPGFAAKKEFDVTKPLIDSQKKYQAMRGRSHSI